MTSAHAGFGRLVVALRWPIVILWIIAAVAATAALPSIDESQNGALGDLVPNESAALEAELRSSRLFGFPVLSRTVVVQRDADGLAPLAQAATVDRAVALNRDELAGLERIGGAIPVLNTIEVPPFTRERGTTAITCCSDSTRTPMSSSRSPRRSPSAHRRCASSRSPAARRCCVASPLDGVGFADDACQDDCCEPAATRPT